jgi:hypothetical protein
MKSIYLSLILLTTLCIPRTYGQEVKEKKDAGKTFDFATAIDSLKKTYDSLGFSLLREAPLQMESGYEFPAVVELKENSQYQFVFIGEYSSRLYEVRMYDWDEKQVTYIKKLWGDIDGNIISYNYTCKFSEPHMIKMVQMNKHMKKLRGHFMVFLRKRNNPLAE